MTNTQLSDLQRGFPPDISKPVHNGEPSRQVHELFRANLRDIDLVISVQTMINPILWAILWQSWIIFSTIIFAPVVCGFLRSLERWGNGPQSADAARTPTTIVT